MRRFEARETVPERIWSWDLAGMKRHGYCGRRERTGPVAFGPLFARATPVDCGRSSGFGITSARLPAPAHCEPRQWRDLSEGEPIVSKTIDPTGRPVTAARPRRFFTAFPFQSRGRGPAWTP